MKLTIYLNQELSMLHAHCYKRWINFIFILLPTVCATLGYVAQEQRFSFTI
jgi:hypothetical protein